MSAVQTVGGPRLPWRRRGREPRNRGRARGCATVAPGPRDRARRPDRGARSPHRHLRAVDRGRRGLTFAYARSLATGPDRSFSPGPTRWRGSPTRPGWRSWWSGGRSDCSTTAPGSASPTWSPSRSSWRCCAASGCSPSASPPPRGVRASGPGHRRRRRRHRRRSVLRHLDRPSGLENPLYRAGRGRAAAYWRGRRPRPGYGGHPRSGCGALAALAALTRPEGLIYAAAYPTVMLLLSPAARRAAAARSPALGRPLRSSPSGLPGRGGSPRSATTCRTPPGRRSRALPTLTSYNRPRWSRMPGWSASCWRSPRCWSWCAGGPRPGPPR